MTDDDESSQNLSNSAENEINGHTLAEYLPEDDDLRTTIFDSNEDIHEAFQKFMKENYTPEQQSEILAALETSDNVKVVWRGTGTESKDFAIIYRDTAGN